MADYPPLETERLHLLPVTIEDAAAMQLVFPQWEIVRWLDAGSVPLALSAGRLRSLSHDIARSPHRAGRAMELDDPSEGRTRANLSASSHWRTAKTNHRGFWLTQRFTGRG